jgi:hypothetical protein
VTSRVIFANFLRVLSLAAFLPGILHIVLGLNADLMLGADVSSQSLNDPVLDSQNRFYGACFMLFGAVFLVIASNLERYALILKCAIWVLFIAGLARGISVWLHGWPTPFIILLFVIEILAPVILWWFSMLSPPNATAPLTQ